MSPRTGGSKACAEGLPCPCLPSQRSLSPSLPVELGDACCLETLFRPRILLSMRKPEPLWGLRLRDLDSGKFVLRRQLPPLGDELVDLRIRPLLAGVSGDSAKDVTGDDYGCLIGNLLRVSVVLDDLLDNSRCGSSDDKRGQRFRDVGFGHGVSFCFK